MKFYTTQQDADYILTECPHLKTGVTNCNCGETSCYYDYNATSTYYDIIAICDNCYIECSNKERI